MIQLHKAAKNVVEVWKLYGTHESLRGWMEILEAALAESEERQTMTPKELAASLKRGEKWKVAEPLTDAEIADLWHQSAGFHHHFARAVERAVRGEA